MDVNPEKAKKRREHMARRTRVERWAEDSGNAGLAGRELPPAEVLAADQRVTAWAKQLRKAGLDGDMDQLRAKAFLDLLLGTDSRPLASSLDGTHGQTADVPDGGGSSSGGPGGLRTPAPARPLSGLIPPGFAGRVTLTIPAATLLGLADRPGEMAGLGPIDPDLARDLAAAAARSARSTWCVTVTDRQGHAIGHGCARPAPAGRGRRTCLCNGNPKCRFDHRVKQDPLWKCEQLPSEAPPLTAKVDRSACSAVLRRSGWDRNDG